MPSSLRSKIQSGPVKRSGVSDAAMGMIQSGMLIGGEFGDQRSARKRLPGRPLMRLSFRLRPHLARGENRMSKLRLRTSMSVEWSSWMLVLTAFATLLLHAAPAL